MNSGSRAIPEAVLVLSFVTKGCPRQLLAFRISHVPTSFQLREKYVTVSVCS